MYEDYAFGPGTMRGDEPPLIPADGATPRPHGELLEWLREGHGRWLTSICALPDDAELDHERLTNWGDRLPTRDIIHIMIGHRLLPRWRDQPRPRIVAGNRSLAVLTRLSWLRAILVGMLVNAASSQTV